MNSTLKSNIRLPSLLRSEGQIILRFRNHNCYLVRLVTFDKENKLTMCLSGGVNGSLASLIPVEDGIAKRLQLLQGQLTRNMQHFAALNPRAHRSVGASVQSGMI
jgi:cleavage and polyadenylation specificity factor subunit 1